jgi:Kdo2-lipid IVA lauroyltransferase/acyltransferase
MGGAWTPLQRTKNDLLWLAIELVLAAVRPLPPRALRWLGRGLGKLAHACARSARRIARENVALVLPGLDPRAQRKLVQRSFATLGEAVGETLSLLRKGGRPAPLRLTPEAKAVFDDALRLGRGVILASAHLGPWERVASSLVSAGVPLVVLARESYDPRLSRIYDRMRAAGGVRVLWRGSPGATAGILRTLKRGEVLGVAMDLRSRIASTDVPFLGHPAATAMGPATIALKAHAPVVIATVAPAPQDALVVSASRIPTDDLGCDPDAVRTLTGRINDELSKRVLALPHAWVWMHPRWAAPREV